MQVFLRERRPIDQKMLFFENNFDTKKSLFYSIHALTPRMNFLSLYVSFPKRKKSLPPWEMFGGHCGDICRISVQGNMSDIYPSEVFGSCYYDLCQDN